MKICWKNHVARISFEELDDYFRDQRSEEEIKHGLHIERSGGDEIYLVYYASDDDEGKCPYTLQDGFNVLMDFLDGIVGFRPTEVAFCGDMLYLMK